MEMMEVQATQFVRVAAQGIDEHVGDAGDAGEVDMIPAPDAAHGFIG
jgi:hypothetical protein